MYLSPQLYPTRIFRLLPTGCPAAEDKLVHNASRLPGVKRVTEEGDEKILILFYGGSEPGCHPREVRQRLIDARLSIGVYEGFMLGTCCDGQRSNSILADRRAIRRPLLTITRAYLAGGAPASSKKGKAPDLSGANTSSSWMLFH